MAYSSTNACINLNQTTERVEGTIAGKVNDVKTNTDEIRATAEKIKEMIERLENQEFTRFWP